jgi:hypothetical protein
MEWWEEFKGGHDGEQKNDNEEWRAWEVVGRLGEKERGSEQDANHNTDDIDQRKDKREDADAVFRELGLQVRHQNEGRHLNLGSQSRARCSRSPQI